MVFLRGAGETIRFFSCFSGTATPKAAHQKPKLSDTFPCILFRGGGLPAELSDRMLLKHTQCQLLKLWERQYSRVGCHRNPMQKDLTRRVPSRPAVKHPYGVYIRESFSAFTSCCSAWVAKCSEFQRCLCMDSSKTPLQMSSPSLMAAGGSNGGGTRYWDLIASGTCKKETHQHLLFIFLHL